MEPTSSAVITFLPQPAEAYRQAKNALYAWRNLWREEIPLVFTAQLPGPEGDLAKTQRALVVIASAAALEDLPPGTKAKKIPELIPVRGLVADVKKSQGWTPWKAGQDIPQFTSAAPVYCTRQFFGENYDRVLATGVEKGTRKFITIPCPTRRLTQWRSELIENPIVVFEMREKGGWLGHSDEEKEIQRLVTFFRDKEAADPSDIADPS